MGKAPENSGGWSNAYVEIIKGQNFITSVLFDNHQLSQILVFKNRNLNSYFVFKKNRDVVSIWSERVSSKFHCLGVGIINSMVLPPAFFNS